MLENITQWKKTDLVVLMIFLLTALILIALFLVVP
jgi:hypothetical protein